MSTCNQLLLEFVNIWWICEEHVSSTYNRGAVIIPCALRVVMKSKYTAEYYCIMLNLHLQRALIKVQWCNQNTSLVPRPCGRKTSFSSPTWLVYKANTRHSNVQSLSGLDWETLQNCWNIFVVCHYIELSYKHGVGRKLQAVGEFWANSTLTLHQWLIDSSGLHHTLSIPCSCKP